MQKIFALQNKFALLCCKTRNKSKKKMKLSNKKSETILNWLTKSDLQEIAGILGYSYGYVRYILKGERTCNNPAGEEIISVALRRARQNKHFRNTSKVA